MSEIEELRAEIKDALRDIEREVVYLNKAGRFDINKDAEEFYRGLLNLFYKDWELKHANSIKDPNYEGVDLLSLYDTSKIAIQITSDNSSEKVKDSIIGFINKALKVEYTTLYIFMIKGKVDFPKANFKKTVDGKFNFDPKTHILDCSDLMKLLTNAELNDLRAIHSYLIKTPERIALNKYFKEQKDQYKGIVLNDENGLTLENSYITPYVQFWKNSCTNQEESTNDVFKTLVHIESLHDFIPYFLEHRLQELKDIKQTKAQLFLLLGYPGQGKTSFCKRVLFDSLTEPLYQNKLFYVRLRDISSVNDLFNNPLVVLFDFINKDINRNTNFLAQDTFDESTLVLDGLDELAMRENMSKFSIDEFVEKLLRVLERFPSLHVILTSRYGYVDLEKLTTRKIIIAQIGKLNEKQQTHWLETYHKYNPNCKLNNEKLIEINNLKNKQYSHLRELINQPILLYLVAKLELEINENATKSSIYTRLFDQLIDRAWDLGQINALNNLKKEHLRTFIREIAFEIFQSEFEYITKTDLEKLPASKEFIEKLGNNLSKEDLLKHLMIAFYMQEVNKNKNDDDEEDKRNYAIEFLHKSLQEYLVAEKIAEKIKQFVKHKDKKYKIDTAEAALELVWNLFTPKLISKEIQENLTELISEYSDDVRKVIFERMMHFAPELLEKHFLYALLPTEPMKGGFYTFRGYWVVLAALKNKQNCVPEDEKSKMIFCNLVENSLVYIKSEFWDLSYVDLSGMSLYKIRISNINLSYANLSHVNLRGADLKDAILINANLNNVDLRNAYLDDADFSHANLSHANLRRANLDGADFSHANLSHANLRSADLDDAILINANLNNVDLSHAELCDAFLINANLRNANLRRANLDDAYLSKADLSDSKYLTIEQLKTVKSLYFTIGIDEKMIQQLEDEDEDFGHLFEEPFEEFENILNSSFYSLNKAEDLPL